mmetsp:Transcript_139152/g.388218  ORF Transcript_139152/g.388218 Transcript_139152/m.388218 type:complete len:275 (-) Transcript_139152:129-953(-)
MRSAIHLHEARAVNCHHDLSVRGPVPDAQCIKDAASVRDQHFGHFGIRRHRQSAEVHEVCTVARPLVIHPDHDCLVHAIPRNVVHDILSAPQVLLHEDCGPNTANHALRTHERAEMGLGLLAAVAQPHALGAGRLHRLYHHRHGLGRREGLDLGPAGPSGLADGAEAGGLDAALLHTFITSVRARAVRPQPHLLRQGISQCHSSLAADDASKHLQAICGGAHGFCGLGNAGLLLDMRVAVQALGVGRHVRAHLRRQLCGPYRENCVAPPGNLGR